jgi:NADPH2:quinone reductase
VRTIPDPGLASGHVVVAPRAVGICGTAVHILDGEFPPSPYPLVPGHELAGDVVAVGPGVDDVREGQRVTVDPSLFCGHCVYCRRQRGNLCRNWGAIGDTVNGGFAEYVAVPAGNVYAIPDGMDFDTAALVEPLSCVVHGLRRLAMPAGSELVVVGAGTIGLLLLQAARVGGAASVAVVDTDEQRRTMAAGLGADRVAGSVEDLLAERELGFEFAVEATGVPAGAEAAYRALCRGGTMMIFGVAPEQARLSLSQFRVYNDELTVLGSMAVLNTFEPALRLMSSGAIDTANMITDRFGLDGFADAVTVVRARRGLKVQIRPGGGGEAGKR